jgi:hypothetical protein
MGVVGLLAASGCESGANSCVLGTESCACTSSRVCDPGLTCDGTPGICRSGSSVGPGPGAAGACNPPCAPPARCMGNRCVVGSAMPMAAGRVVGSACGEDTECNDGMCISEAAMPGGYCSKSCGGNRMSVGSDCPAGSGCFQMNEASAMCLDLCGPGNGDCRGGYRCQAVGTARICIPSCKSDDDCDIEEACNTATGECQPGGQRAPARIGAACQADAECSSGACIPDVASERPRFPGGYCAQLCNAAMENQACGDGGICVGASRADGTRDFLCLGACRSGVDCRDEYICSSDADVQTAAGVGMCVPRCQFYDCGAGESCDSSVGICVAGGMTAGDANVTLQDIGTLPIGPTGREASIFEFQVPPEAISFSVIADGADPTARFALAQMIAPNGKAIYNLNNPEDSAFFWVPVGPPGGETVLFPNAPRVTLVPGKYQMSWVSDRAGSARFSVLFKRQSGVVQAGSLPLVFLFTPGGVLNARSASTDQAFQQALMGFQQIYAAGGITVGPVKYVDVTGPNAQSYVVIDSEDELNQLFTLANDSPENGLHFFMVDQITFGGSSGGTILGSSGGIPGPPSFPGLLHGGVAVSASFLRQSGGAALLATVIAHEAGHYLGLFHTSESRGTSHDPLLDTLECPSTNDRDDNGVVALGECNGQGNDNLMFWQAGDNKVNKLSNDQRFVLMRNPSIR